MVFMVVGLVDCDEGKVGTHEAASVLLDSIDSPGYGFSAGAVRVLSGMLRMFMRPVDGS